MTKDYKISIFVLLLSFCFVSCGRHESKNYEVKGIDVSHYQDNIDWSAILEDTTIDFVFVKATEAYYYKDSMFERNWKALENKRILRGAYHFFRPQMSAEVQAQNFIGTVPLRSGDLPPVLDVESVKLKTVPVLKQKMKLWLDLIEDHYKVRPIIYTGDKFYRDYLTEGFENYHFWIARYNRKSPCMEKWKFWQFSDKGKIKGISEPVDINVFKGSLEELKGFCKP